MSSLLLPSFISLMLLLLLLLLHPAGAGAAEYMVGDGPLGWDTGTNYATWAQNHAFTISDVLVFQYVKSQHNVCEVKESTYRSCDVGGGAGVLRAYTSGYDRVELTEAKTYWFICDFPGHCLGGMKVAVNVSAGAGAGGQSPNVPLPPSGNAASPTGGRRSWMAWAPLALVVINWAR